MSREQRLQHILDNPRVWVASRAAQTHQHNAPIPTGFAELDQQLGGGWPTGVLTEILLSAQGIGELRCLMPALAALTQGVANSADTPAHSVEHLAADTPDEKSWVTWVSPPYIPYAPALTQHGVDICRLLIVRTRKTVDGLWALEQALRSTASVAAIAWCADVDDRALRRIQLAAEVGQCWAVIFRSDRFIQSASPAALRIQLKSVANGLALNVLRNRFGGVANICLSSDQLNCQFNYQSSYQSNHRFNHQANQQSDMN